MMLFFLFSLTFACIPLAYKMGRLTGSDDMRDSIMRHPSLHAYKAAAERSDQAA